MSEKEDKTTEKMAWGERNPWSLKITGYGKIPSILTIVSTLSNLAVKLLTFRPMFSLNSQNTRNSSFWLICNVHMAQVGLEPGI